MGNIELPQTVHFALGGRQSKVVVTDYTFGTSKVLYATAQILFAGQIGGRDVLFLYGDSTQEHEVSLILSGNPRIQVTPSITFFTSSTSDHTTIGFLSGIEGLVTVHDSDQQLILYSDKHTAATFWAPVIPSSSSTFANYWQFGTNASLLVGGPFLVRNASIVGEDLALYGDLQTSVRLIVIAPDSITSITWNGRPVSADTSLSAALTTRGGFVGQLQTRGSAASIVTPALDKWKFADSLPEIQANYSDASWTIANHTSTKSPYKPYYGDRILYGCDYELCVSFKPIFTISLWDPTSCENIVLWRGHFHATGNEQSMNLSINGGEGIRIQLIFSGSRFWLSLSFRRKRLAKWDLSQHFVWKVSIGLDTCRLFLLWDSSTNNKHILEETDDIYFFPEGSLLIGQDNVITVIQVW